MKTVPASLGRPRPGPMIADRIRSMLGALLVLIGFLALVQAASGAEPPPRESRSWSWHCISPADRAH